MTIRAMRRPNNPRIKTLFALPMDGKARPCRDEGGGHNLPLSEFKNSKKVATMIAAIQRLIDHETKLALPASRLTPRADLFALGLTAFDAVRLLVAIEREFKVEFPHAMLKCETVQSIEAIALALRAAQPVPVCAEALRSAA